MNTALVVNYVNYFRFYGRQSSLLPLNVKSVPCSSDYVEGFRFIFKPMIFLFRYTLYLQTGSHTSVKLIPIYSSIKSYLCLYFVVFSLRIYSTCNNSFKYYFINLCIKNNEDNSYKTNYNNCVNFCIICIFYLWCNSVLVFVDNPQRLILHMLQRLYPRALSDNHM
jgi:hypothetical protein